jgi:hypothetical protein
MSLISNKKSLVSILSLLLLFVLFLPFISSAANAYTPLITCDGSTAKPCNFDAFIGTVNRIINWIISMAGVIFTISLIYGGFLYITSGGDSGKKSKANGILWNTLIGFVIILASWLIVYTVIKALAADTSGIMRFLK